MLTSLSNFDNVGAYTVCTLIADLSPIPASEWDIVVSEDVYEYYRLQFSVNLTIQDEVLMFELIHNGISYGEVRTKYE